MTSRTFIKDRTLGAAGIAGLFALQSAYEFLFCGGGAFGFWEITLILALSPIFFLLTSGSRAALTSCVVLVPFILLANGIECSPYKGGGAAMGYVPAILFGMPLSFLAGVVMAVFVFFQRSKAKNGGE